MIASPSSSALDACRRQSIDPLSRDEERAAFARLRAGDEAALEQIVRANLRFVTRVALAHQGQGLSLDDLIAEGNLGLLVAVERFDETRGLKFITYAVWWIRQRILAAIANHTVVRRPCTVRNAAYKLTTTTRRLSQQLHRSPTDDELAEDTGLSLDCIHDVRGGYPELSLDAALSEDPNAGDLSDVLGVPPPPHSDVSPYLSGLTEREQTVLIDYYGLDRDPPRTLAEIGRDLGITRERVRQVRNEALETLRRRFGSGALAKVRGSHG